jgi:hypothetical protein
VTHALVVPVSGPIVVADWDLSEQAEPAGLVTLQGAVGGWIEAIHGPGWHAYVNEDGRMLGLPPNERATLLAYEFGWGSGQMLLGTVVFLGSAADPDEHDCPQEMVLRAMQFPPIQ